MKRGIFRQSRRIGTLALSLGTIFLATTLTSCEDDPILTPNDQGGGTPGSYGTIKIAIPIVDESPATSDRQNSSHGITPNGGIVE